MTARPIVLASASPRRRELITYLVNEIESIATDSEESFDPSWDPWFVAEDLARRKAIAGSSMRPDAVVIAADTIVVLEGGVLNKPDDRMHARRMLEALSGKCHVVYTGVAVWDPDTQSMESGFVSSAVEFKFLNSMMIEQYLASGVWTDKAGAYGIQGPGGDIVASVTGCFQNVVGLPVCTIGKMLRHVGVSTLSSPIPCGLRTPTTCPDWPPANGSGSG